MALFVSVNLSAQEMMTPEQAVKLMQKKGMLDGLQMQLPELHPDTKVNQLTSQIKNPVPPPHQQHDTEPVRPSQHFSVYVSLSMPRSVLMETLRNAGSSQTVVYINGMFEGDKTIMDTMRRLEVIAGDMNPKPNVKFGPKWFTKYAIGTVPAVIYDDGNFQAKVSGLSSIEFMQQELANGRQDFSNAIYGATWPVKEESLIVQLQRSMSKIDWKEKQKQAVANFWKKKSPYHLPQAQEDRVFYIDPTVTVTKDIDNKRGVVLARKGQTINPLNAIPGAYLGTFIVNPQEQRQLSWLDKQLPTMDVRDQIIVTGLEANRGWEQLNELRKRYKREIYLLDEHMVNRFALKALPSKIVAEKGYLKISEYGASSL